MSARILVMTEMLMAAEVALMGVRRMWRAYLERRAYAGHGRHALVMA